MQLEECTVCEESSGKGGTVYGWGQGLEMKPPPSFLGSDPSALMATPVLGLGPMAGSLQFPGSKSQGAT